MLETGAVVNGTVVLAVRAVVKPSPVDWDTGITPEDADVEDDMVNCTVVLGISVVVNPTEED